MKYNSVLMFNINIVIIVSIINSINAVIEQQPIFTSQPVDTGALFSGTRAILQCTASGTPAISYRWLKDNQQITNKSSSNGGVLLISQVDRFKDVGVYQCIAENKLGSVLSNKAKLTVAYMEQLKLPYPTNIRVRQGHAAIIKMPKMFDAYPMPTIEWFAGGALIEPNAKFAITKDFDLVVLRCDKADEKSYYVEASSIHTGSKIRSREIRLHIIDTIGSFNQDDITSSNEIEQIMYGQQQIEDNTEDLIDMEFVVKPQDTISVLNANLIKFDCIVNSRRHQLDQIETYWYKDDQVIDINKTKYRSTTRTLEIISVTDQDAGIYMCSAKFSSSSIDQKNSIHSINASAKLDVYIKPTFKTQPENLIETDFGKTVQLKCDGISNPVANITWYRNSEQIDFNKFTNLKLEDSGTKLVINSISLKDQAIYQCFLSNNAGHISASTLIRIISFPPKFTQNIQNRTVYSDSNISISCGKVDGSPKPIISWSRVYYSKTSHDSDLMLTRNEESIIPINEQSENQYLSQNGELIIKNLNTKSHEGWYMCDAKNLLGSINARMYLKVNKKTEIIEPPMDVSVTKGQSALFKCTVSKEDDIDIDLQWKFNNMPLNFKMSDDGTSISNDFKLFPNGTLQVLEAKNTDIGSYKCIVKSLNNNLAGNDSKTARLDVVELPYAPENVRVHLNNMTKRSVNLTWDSSFDGNSAIIKYIVHARITSSEDNMIQYENSRNQKKQPEYNDWSVIKDVELSSFNYNYENSYQQADERNSNQKSLIRWTLLFNLKPSFVYEFRVSALNKIGEGMPSRPSNNICIPEEVPSEAPRNIHGYALDSKTINVQWIAPPFESWNGRLRGYEIAYTLTFGNTSWRYLKIDDPLSTSVNLTDLIVWEMYQIKVRAFNTIGYGKFNDQPLRIRTKEGIPIRAPTGFQANALNSTCISISWKEPPAQFVNGIIQGYKLVFYENENHDLKKTKVISLNDIKIQQSFNFENTNHNDNKYSYQICNLYKFTLYTLSILCFTNSGDGPLTQPIQLKTLEDIPGEVNDISFINVYDKSIDIEWKPPLQPNGKILSYVILYKPINDNKNEKFEKIILDSSQTNFTLYNLKSSTEYTIGIRAKTQAGDGVLKFTQIKSGVPPELPEPPKAIVLRTIGQTWVELEFIPGYNGKTSINKWIVEALILNHESNPENAENKNNYENQNLYKWHRIYEKSNSPNATKLTVENLEPFKNYSLRMYSQNVKGRSKASLPTEKFQTLADVPSQAPLYSSARLNTLYKNTTKPNDIDVLIKWSPIPTKKWNGIPFGYILSINECASTENTTQLLNETRRVEIGFNKYEINSYLLKSLSSFKCYIIRIAAWNNVGIGPFTSLEESIVLNRTSQSSPSKGPQNVNLYSVNSTSIKVVWLKLDEKYTNGLLIGYKIKYAPDLASSSSNQINISLLLNKTLYDYNYYNCYESKEYNEDNDYNYLSNFNPKEVYLILNSHNFKDKRYEMLVNNLMSNVNYKIEIAACTRAGCGEYSEAVSLKTNEYLPSRPIDLKFTHVNLTSVQIEWKQPRYPNGILKTYRIRYIPKKYKEATHFPLKETNDENVRFTPQFEWSTVYLNINSTTVQTGKNSLDRIYKLNVTGLSKMEYYIFSISANNTSGMGWGSESEILVYTIDGARRSRPDSPNKPTISKSSIKTNELTINWNTNSENYSPIRYFTIQINEINYEKFNKTFNLDDYLNMSYENSLNYTNINYFNFDLNWRTIYLYKITGADYLNNFSLKIKGKDKQGNLILKPNGYLYKFRISATNDVGTSEFSAESDLIRTKQNLPKSNSNSNQNILPLKYVFNKLNVNVLTTSKIALTWNEFVNLKNLNDNDYLTKFKLVYKLIGLNNKIPQLMNNPIEFSALKSTNFENYDENLSTNGLGDLEEVELIINYKNTTKFLFDYRRNHQKYSVDFGFIKHEYILENSFFLENGTYEFYLCGINLVGESKDCIHSKRLIYIEDRLPQFKKNAHFIENIVPISSTELNVTWRRAQIEHINGKLYAYKIVFFNNEILDIINDLIKKNAEKYANENKFINNDADDYDDEQHALDELYISSKSSLPTNEYELLKLVDKNDMINIIIVEPNITNIIVNNLKPYKNYSCFIKLINQGGELINMQTFSELTNSRNNLNLKVAQTLQSVPSQPDNLSFNYVSYTHLNITWLKPSEPNGIILAYELWYENVPHNSTNSAKTKIIRQEIYPDSALGLSNNFTLFINNLEPEVYYKFKVRCRTEIDWGPYIERQIKTGPQDKLAPLSPSKPMYTTLNDTHSLLEWKAYANNYDLFVIEIKYIVINKPNEDLIEFNNNKNLSMNSALSNHSMITPDNFEFFSYSNKTNIFIRKNDNRFNIKSRTVSNSVMTLCIFRVSSFNSISISEPSPNSELIHISKLFDGSGPSEKNSKSALKLSTSNLNQLFYLNWWFLVIIALSSLTILIIIVLIMFLRGKNKKFLLKRKNRMNKMEMMKFNKSKNERTSTLQTEIKPDIILEDHLDHTNQIPISLSNNNNNKSNYASNSHLIITNSSNSLTRNNSTDIANLNAQYPVYDLRKSMRGGIGGASNIYNVGSIRTATYVSPNGTLSRVNMNVHEEIISNNDDNESQLNSLQPLILNGSLVKRQQINGLRNTRNLTNLIGMHNIVNNLQTQAQPNDYCSSGRIGAIINDVNMDTSVHNNINTNDNRISDWSNLDNDSRNHYLIPFNPNDQYGSAHLKKKIQTLNIQEHTNRSFKYSSSDTENESHTKSIKRSTLNDISPSKNTYGTSSFGRQPEQPNLQLQLKKSSDNEQEIKRDNRQLPANYIKSTFNDKIDLVIGNSLNFQNKNEMNNNINKKPPIMNMYYDHQQIKSEIDTQPTYYTHQSPKLHPSPPIIPINKTVNLKPQNIQMAASNTAEALGALANASAVPPPLIQPTTLKFNNHYNDSNYNSNVQGPKKENSSLINQQQSQQRPQHNQASISSVPFSGDRVVMNNVAGSRKPLTGFSSFN